MVPYKYIKVMCKCYIERRASPLPPPRGQYWHKKKLIWIGPEKKKRVLEEGF